jgi:adenylate cyclase
MPKGIKKYPTSQKTSDSALDIEKIQLQHQKILDSPDFQATKNQRKFFQFVVSETLAERAHEIKGYTVATQVFKRKASFDPNLDPIVSIQANKLRRALERYYLVAGQNDPIRIDIPKGTYVPTFFEQTEIESDGTPHSCEKPDAGCKGSWPNLVVRPFENLTGDPDMDHFGIGLATELAIEIARSQDIQVISSNLESGKHGSPEGSVRFAISGNVRKGAAGIKIAVQLTDTKCHKHIWGDIYHSDLKPDQLIAFQENVAQKVAAMVGSEYGILVKTLSKESKSFPLSDIGAYEAILKYYEFEAKFTPDTFYSAFEALKMATTKEPKFALIWSMLARLYANNHGLELFDVETPLKEAHVFAEKGVNLDPGSQQARVMLAYVLLLKNELTAGMAEIDRALALNSNSLIFLEHIGYLMTLLGDWKRGTKLIKNTIKINPYYNIIVHHALWMDWFRQENYQQACLETLNFRTPMLFWDPLIKAVTFGWYGRIDAGRQAVKDLLTLKPDFPNRGRVLIGNYIKFDEIVERVIGGLNKVGLSIE